MTRTRGAGADRSVGLQREAAQFLARAGLFRLGQRRVADEIALVQRDAETDTGLVGRVVGGHVGTPVDIAFFKPQRFDGAVTGIAKPQWCSCFHKGVKDGLSIFDRQMQFPSQFADIGYPHGENRTSGYSNSPGLGKGKPGVADIVAGHLLQDCARLWSK